MKYLLLIIPVFFLISCGGNSNDYKVIDDLPFNKAGDAKEYADVVLKAIRTNREIAVQQEFADPSSIQKDSLGMFVGMYSTAISGRDDWEFIDVYKDATNKNDADGFDYAWLDPSGRLGLQIKIIPVGTSKGFDLERIEFRSRLDVVDSRAFPGGKISDYEKLDYDWEAKMKRTMEKLNKE